MKIIRTQALWFVGLVCLLTALPGNAQKPGEIIPGHYLVRFKADSSNPALTAHELSRAHGFRVRHVYRFALRGMAIEVPAGAEVQVLSALRRNPHVRSIGNDRYLAALAQVNPKGLRRIKGEPGVGANAGNGIRVAVVDSGLDFSHPDLAGNIDTNLSVSCTSDNGTCVPGGQDDESHGTFVGGIIAALNNSIDIVGTGPEITLVAVKGLKSDGSGSFTDITAGIDYLTGLNQAGTRIDVVNMSLGATCSVCTDDSTDPELIAFHDAIRALVDSGTTVVVASGNDGQDARNTVPAAYDEVITVSALVDSDGQPGGLGPPLCVAPFMGFCFGYGDDDTFAAFANYGADVDVIAPGVEETSLNLGGGTINGASGSGTSFASPHAAGVAALLIRDRLNRGEPPPSPGTVRLGLIETGECPEGNGTVFHGTQGCSEIWLGDPDGIPEPLVRADNVVNFGGPPSADDVAVTSISIHSPVAVNSTESIDVGVANQGTIEETFDVSLTDNSEPFSVGGSPQSITLGPGASTTVTFSWTPSVLGDHGLTAAASIVAGETNTADNTKEVTVSVLPPTHDVAVTSIAAPPSVAQGSTVDIVVEVGNEGTFDEMLTVSVEDQPSSGAGTVSGAQTVTLTPGTSAPLTFTWDTTNAALGVHTLIATVNLVPDEADTTDNSKSTTATVNQPPTTAPASLVATAVSSSQVTLSWVDTTDNEDGFKIERCNGPASTCGTDPANYLQIAQTGPNATTFNDVTVSDDRYYTYRVRAFNAAGDSPYSNIDDARVPLSPPSSLVAVAVSSSQIDLTWQDNSDSEVNMRVFRCLGTAAFCDANPGNFFEVAALAVNFTSWSDTGRNPDTTYSYQVRASNPDSGYSAPSNTAEATTFAVTSPPNAPSSLSATTASTSAISLSWLDNSGDELGFRVERCQGAACNNFAQIIELAANSTAYTDTGLLADTTYNYQVLAFNSVGDSPYSNTAQATTGTPPSAPNAPSNLVAVAVSSSQIDLTWQDNSSNEINMRVFRCLGTAAFCDANPGNFFEVTALAVNFTSWSDTGRNPDTTYSYLVRASNTDGYSAPSNTAEATTLGGGSAPIAPSNLNATAASTSAISLSWLDNSGDELGFRVERCQGAACNNFAQIIELAANSTAYTDTGLLADTTYNYQVLAFNSVGDSPYSNTAQATTAAPPSPPNAPSNLVAMAVSSSQIDLTWQDNSSDEINMRVFRCLGTAAFCDANPGSFVEITALAANSTNWSNTGLNPNTTYSYQVRASNPDGYSTPSNTAEATTLSILAPPAAPSDLVALSGGGGKGKNASPEFVDLAWQDNSDNEDGFVIERCVVEGRGRNKTCTFGALTVVSADVALYHDGSVAGKTAYRYRVKAQNSAGDSGYSNEAEVNTP